ncbi:MAG: MotA/TolQ/ExbB proton channel family protein [Bryobacterales bacterium]
MNVATLFALLLQAVPAGEEAPTEEMMNEALASSGAGDGLLDMVLHASLLAQIVLLVLLGFSILSWAIAFSKNGVLKQARRKDVMFLKAFRRVGKLADMNAATEQYRPAPLVSMFEFGYEELARQVNKYGRIRSGDAIERVMRLAANEETSRLSKHMGWLATTASAAPFIGLFGTVWGVLESFRGLGAAGGATLRAVAPGIAEALIATAFGLFAAIPALIFYNYFSQQIREIRSRMEDFGLEFYNLAERDYGEDDGVYEQTRPVRR